MKKILICLMFFMLCNFTVAPQDSGQKEEGFYYFLNDKIGSNVVVNLIYNDVSISGVLLDIFNDGIIIKTVFNEIFINKESIAYVKIKSKTE